MDPAAVLGTTLLLAGLVGVLGLTAILVGLLVAAGGAGLRRTTPGMWRDVRARSDEIRARMRDRYLARREPPPPAPYEPFVPEPSGPHIQRRAA